MLSTIIILTVIAAKVYQFACLDNMKNFLLIRKVSGSLNIQNRSGFKNKD